MQPSAPASVTPARQARCDALASARPSLSAHVLEPGPRHRGASRSAPAGGRGALDLPRLELVNGASFVDEALAERQVDLLAIPDSLRAALAPHLPDFSFLLDDLSRHTEEELHARAATAALRLVLSAMRLGRDGQPADLARWATLLVETLAEPDGLRAFEALLRYLVAVRDDDFIDVLVKATNDTDVETIAMTYKDRLIEQGKEKGRAEGRADGVRRVLAKQLQLKFGALDEKTETLLGAAALDQLEAWSERVLTAETLEAVFRED